MESLKKTCIAPVVMLINRNAHEKVFGKIYYCDNCTWLIQYYKLNDFYSCSLSANGHRYVGLNGNCQGMNNDTVTSLCKSINASNSISSFFPGLLLI